DRILVALQMALHDPFWQFIIANAITLVIGFTSIIIRYLQFRQGSKKSASDLSSSTKSVTALKQAYQADKERYIASNMANLAKSRGEGEQYTAKLEKAKKDLKKARNN